MAKKKSKESKEIVVTDNALPAHLADLEGNTDGMENMRGSDMLLPRFSLMQGLSPKVIDKEAEAGEILNSLTSEILIECDEKMEFIPVYHYLEWIQWGEKEEGIIDTSLDPDGELAQRAARGETRVNNEGKEVRVVTEYHNFVVVCPSMDPMIPITISCAKSNHRQGKKLLSLSKFRGSYPLYAGKYTVTAFLDTNKKGDKYYRYEFENAGWLDETLMDEVKELYAVLKKAFEERRIVTDQTEPISQETEM